MQTITKISTGKFVITRYTCHICIYLLIVIIIIILRLFLRFTITPLIEAEVLLLFVVIVRWFWTFRNNIIYLYPYLKHLKGWCSVRCLSKSPAQRYFSLSFIIYLKHFSVGWLVPAQKLNFRNNIFSLIVSTRTWIIIKI